ncbi:hypothetical protein A2526_02440 [candidate division WOR-1 bacterium RIFOXYD2_FULL_36_8]|uniref:PorV/PorQ family protein n=1 Tax=candidate division WOR-1 bacterium RIFOXYB2_FULL_36_35 TaxID=1802578 RepID=A0A1F4S4C4_UNCSA|nr:MAG: hypothetical protein A2230_00985 [candidate division WOR-1 bacterium RIFOXYA2_FULL_36_21]OGC14255.1 MAG: hypothetical protein A2282_06700 [candidate division WOR-1 bacterium RIFOXYA12_FULL_36_13]OGC15260.1 MAG: hypothetical protein A2290_03195 [candidate division WOR-1 bacterium RIFOXYB2_FULL_36_35]OGC37824.1 MAG: hypothetical protein A2526_02440 [candidate division WOR-1 bacterium RIFOXYD2_FULL_36_8]
MKSISIGVNAQTGTFAGDYLKLNGNAKASAMGGAFIGVSDDPSATFWNPSGLSQIKRIEILSTYMNYFAGISYISFAFSSPVMESTLGLSVDYVNMGQIEETTPTNPTGTGRFFSPASLVIATSYARNVLNNLFLGGSFKLINDTIDTSNASGYGVDLGMLWNANAKGTFGITLKNIVGSLGNTAIPSNYGVGYSYKLDDILFAADLNLPSDDNMFANFGIEYSFEDSFFVRSGLTSKQTDNSSISFGIGFISKNIQFDYAFVPHSELDTTHQLTIKFMPDFTRKNPYLTPIIHPD